MCSIRVATNDRQEPEFHDCVLWRQLAEFAGQYLAKGRLVYVQGRLHGRSWQAENGTTRRSVEVIAEDLQVLDRPPAKDGGTDTQPDEG
jgi:single-strand DNA-binding protein